MTLTEVAKRLNEINSNIKYVTCDGDVIEGRAGKPVFDGFDWWGNGDYPDWVCILSMDVFDSLDLSDYTNGNGIVDYGKCIVEV